MKIKCEVDGEIGERDAKFFSYDDVTKEEMETLARIAKRHGFKFLDFQNLFDARGDGIDYGWMSAGGEVSFE